MAAFTSHKTESSCFPSSSSTPHWNHHVFLSFRGKDTRNNFTGHLYKAFKQVGLRTFIDEDELSRGKEISPELRKAIRESRICIIVFSKNYASSRWCLDELLEIFECKKNMGRLVLPIFYDVDPADVRYQRGSFADAFATHNQRFVADMEKQKVDMWRAALTEAANLSGYCLKTDANGHEARFIDKVVADVLLEVDPKYLHVSDNLVGIDYRVEEIISLLNIGSDDVCTIGIYGLGGIGKTTVAKAVFNKILHKFECSYFADKGIVLMNERFLSRKALIVLDDLDDSSQIKSLAEQRNHLGSGSRIIISTRDVHLLNQAEVDKRYEVMELNYNESLELFSRHAFKKLIPSKDYVLLSHAVVNYCKGLPLALEVIGSYLFDKTTVEWKSSLEKLHQVPHNDIQEKLKISFDALGDDKVKAIFLDLACFFINWKKDYLINVWNACEFFAEDGISNLTRKCLLKIDNGDLLMMHDHLRDMGREIIRKESPNRPANRSRLWRREDVINVLAKNKGIEVIEAIILDLSGSKKMHFNTRTFERMDMLRLLQIDNVHLTGSFENLFEELKWLHWHYCSLECFPPDFQPEKLVILDMQHSQLDILWHDIKVLENLTILDLKSCKCMTKTPNFSGLQRLERLILKDCTSLLEVDPSIGLLLKLRYLDLSECEMLYNIPISICELESLEELYLYDCSNLERLPEQIGNIKCLRKLDVRYTAIMHLPDSIGLLSRLVYLDLGCCVNLRTLASSICDLGSLEELHLRHCSNLEKLPEQLGNLKCLRKLDVSNTTIMQLPDSIGLLSRLVYLDLQCCMNLRILASSICDLGSLEVLCLSHCLNLEKLPEQLGNLKCLRKLDISNTTIMQLPDSIGLLSRLVYLDLRCCMNLRILASSICDLGSLEVPRLSHCLNLKKLSEQLGNLKCSRKLDVSNVAIMQLPDSIGLFSRLVYLDLRCCMNLRTLTSSICDLGSLEVLCLSHCLNLEKLPEQLGNLKCLRKLDASNTAIMQLPDSIGLLTRLMYVVLRGCMKLRKLPSSIYDL